MIFIIECFTLKAAATATTSEIAGSTTTTEKSAVPTTALATTSSTTSLAMSSTSSNGLCQGYTEGSAGGSCGENEITDAVECEAAADCLGKAKAAIFASQQCCNRLRYCIMSNSDEVSFNTNAERQQGNWYLRPLCKARSLLVLDTVLSELLWIKRSLAILCSCSSEATFNI